VNLLICVATSFEAGILRQGIDSAASIRVIETGVGPVNAAHGVTVAIMEGRPDAILSCGIAGAYPSSGLRIGDVVCAQVEVYGDLGAQSPSGFLDMKELGFPTVSEPSPLFNELPLQLFPADRRARFVTVSTCTGTDAFATEIQARTRGEVENMEGAAIAHVAHLHRIPVGEVRGISNMVTNRDKSGWRLRDASEAAQQATLQWLRTQDLKTSRP
jgi:futalosine hydrolase